MHRVFISVLVLGSCYLNAVNAQISKLKQGFLHPPDSAKPGVYWYFMDGNMSARSISEDLEAMKKAGIGNLVFLEVNVGIPRGKVEFLSDEWQELFAHAVKESKRLGIEITLGIGPGWTGSGGPWVPIEQSMQHLVSSTVNIAGGGKRAINLPIPAPKPPYFGEGAFTPELKKQWDDFYEDVAVLAYPTPSLPSSKITDIDEKALYYRAPYSSVKGVKQYLPTVAEYKDMPKNAAIDKSKIIDLTDKLRADGTLNWTAPKGNWTIIRFGRRNNGAITRPAPVPGLGFEADKFDTVALNAHLDNYVGKLVNKTGRPDVGEAGGLKRLHMDSWEMGAQNWTPHFREEFKKRRGYDPLPYYPVYAGNVVESEEISERFLWDLRQTAQELVLENHAGQVKKYAHKFGLELSIEPYDMNPTADLELGSVADVPMAEFWNKGLGFNSSFSCIEATSIGHVNGKSLVPAEAFTAQDNEGWKQYPGAMKNQGDWAFATGINRFVYHTFQNQFLADSLRPGATMGPYGVHWDRNQTWWPMVGGYHDYISRCQYILQQGQAVADILYLSPEGSPHVFRPPSSAMDGDLVLPDRKGYNFDGCSPGQLYKAIVKNKKIVFPGGSSYRLLVLPAIKTMTPALLQKITSLVNDGAVVVGAPPLKSPGLSGYPSCDEQVRTISRSLWGTLQEPSEQITHTYGKGKIIWGGSLDTQINDLYPEYDLTAQILKSMNVEQDFTADGQLRYTHRYTDDMDIYFVSNRTDQVVQTDVSFRSVKGHAQLWDPITGESRALPECVVKGQLTTLPLKFDAYQSYFVCFVNNVLPVSSTNKNFSINKVVKTLAGPWLVSFDPKWGGPPNIVFNELKDWTQRTEEGIKYYSGTAVYHKIFDLPRNLSSKENQRLYLDLGEIKNMGRVILNGKNLGVTWTAPFRVDITNAVLEKQNHLEIEVVNLWPNRLIGDENFPDDGINNGKWPDWLTKGLPRTSHRFTFSTYKFYTKDSPLLKSGLIGPVTIQQSDF
ncbi:glycosyl hydrolase [Mucilaginibacter sabulilitoris]|uniref:Glycosyl hydrolase n=1 Tax=Mucilaginibacter sabulilitoris TaxID=1173583 RepID=A0ABZ0TKI8_9SPHI|nr:glycosyl hydrolase [Mucilaginibacter sabulilitoris]WPU92060.1 glycosyl hydrolase [Mucilaginibacter sabulilitoris]